MAAAMRRALHAEWTKLRTAPGTIWLLLAIVAMTVAVSAMAAATYNCRTDGCVLDPVRLSLTGVQLGQAVVAILAVLMISGEHSTGMVRITLTAMPGRGVLLAAKAVLLAAVVMAVSAPAVLVSLLAGQHLLADNMFSLKDGPVMRAGLGSILYLALIALLSLGIGVVVRDAASAIGVVLGLLYIFPIVAQMATDPDWQRRLLQIGPTTAGSAIQATEGLADLPHGPWAGLGVLAAWAAGALLTGGLLLRMRDA